MSDRLVAVVRSVVVLLAVLVPVAARGQNAPSRVGVNLAGPDDWGTDRAFIDAVKTARRPWGAVARPWADGNIPTDTDGWPLADFGLLIDSSGLLPKGDYKLSVVGKVTLGGGTFRVMGVPAYDAKTNTTSATLRWGGGTNAYLALTNADRNDGTGRGGVGGVKLLRPGYASDAAVFTDEFKTCVRPFGVVRLMDAMRTNNNPVARWAERSRPESATYSTATGWPYEIALRLARDVGCDLWINVPARADDDYLERLAALLKAGVPAGRHCYVEYSNEVWNGLFNQFAYNVAEAEREAAADPLLRAAGPNKYYWGWARTAGQAAKISRLFGGGGGDGADGRFRVVYATQLGYKPYGHQAEAALAYVRAKYGEPGRLFWSIAVAPYFGAGSPALNSDASSAAQVAAQVLENANANGAGAPWAKPLRDLAGRYGLRLDAYEYGPDLGQGPKALIAKTASHQLPDMAAATDVVTRGLLDGAADSVACYYFLAGRYTRQTQWGLTDQAGNVAGPKYQGLATLAAQYPQPGAAPTTVPSTSPSGGTTNGEGATAAADFTLPIYDSTGNTGKPARIGRLLPMAGVVEGALFPPETDAKRPAPPPRIDLAWIKRHAAGAKLLMLDVESGSLRIERSADDGRLQQRLEALKAAARAVKAAHPDKLVGYYGPLAWPAWPHFAAFWQSGEYADAVYALNRCVVDRAPVAGGLGTITTAGSLAAHVDYFLVPFQFGDWGNDADHTPEAAAAYVGETIRLHVALTGKPFISLFDVSPVSLTAKTLPIYLAGLRATAAAGQSAMLYTDYVNGKPPPYDAAALWVRAIVPLAK